MARVCGVYRETGKISVSPRSCQDVACLFNSHSDFMVHLFDFESLNVFFCEWQCNFYELWAQYWFFGNKVFFFHTTWCMLQLTKVFFLRYVIKLRWISWLINFINFFAETNNFFRKIFVGFLLFSFFSSFALILILPKVVHFLSTPSSSQMN